MHFLLIFSANRILILKTDCVFQQKNIKSQLLNCLITKYKVLKNIRKIIDNFKKIC